MNGKTDAKSSSLGLPTDTVVQLDELGRSGSFQSREAAGAVAVERLYVEKISHPEVRRAAFEK